MSVNNEKSTIVLSLGSRYRIKSLEARDKPLVTSGKFLGYTAIGHDEGMCIEMDSTHEDKVGKIRVIPTHAIVSLDIIEAVDKEEKKTADAGTMFG
ncbi:MAG: hypothetical protein KKH41_09215 [Candidatus Thermoplasmatota archaeon]|nr:hypothetical protein [Candidatus Thermoplasmatota archaeon]MBU4071200.1 hypothetical protein [Candidatus Thermoplasmatota archaeon]MBU4592745.1 hypothetical protein [Candidatus Thermoplasmatota archaeon]